jgi:hypothetical protein
MATAIPGQPPPSILQIHREPLKPGSEVAYDAIEADTARVAAALGCPHPYVGIESLTGPKEVWWFNGYESSAEQQRVGDEYAKNTRLMAALFENSKRKAELTLAPIQIFAKYRPDWTVGAPWILGRGRFLVITVGSIDRPASGTTFEAADGALVVVSSADTQEQANRSRTLAGHEAHIFAVRPEWSVPAAEWIAADPMFWQPRGSR